MLDELADVLIDRIDQLLDRLADRAMAAPSAGTRLWESAWNERETVAGRVRADEQARVRAELTRRVMMELGSTHSALVTAGVADRPLRVVRPRGAKTDRRRGRLDEAQLAFF